MNKVKGIVKWFNDANYLKPKKKRKDFNQRFFSKVKKTESCWFWTGAITNGYGTFTVFDGRCVKAHRVSFYLHNGDTIPKGMVLDHICRNRHCVNPKHLEIVTQQTNLRRGQQATKTKCANGHERTVENTAVRKNGHKYCRICNGTKFRKMKT